ncbi:MAG: hypothetical protein ABSE87_02175 [Terracidiphilus sp.]
MTQSDQLANHHYLGYPAPSFSYARNLSPSLALEGTFQPTSQFLKTNSSGSGRETLALGGIKTGWRNGRLGLYGKAQAGVASFSCGTWFYDPNPYTGCARQTNFALEYGGVVEYHLRPRYAIRLDAGDLLIAEFDHIVARYSNGTPYFYQAGGILQHFDARIGVTRSFGHLEEANSERVPKKQSWDTGVMFALQPRTMPEFQFLNPYLEWGVWASWNFSKHVSWDTTMLHSPRNRGPIEDIDFQAGGRAFEVLSGGKIGIRRDHMGYFALARPGTITFGKTERQLGSLPNGNLTFDNGMFTDFVFETGGAYEVYPSRHSILRFEAGNAEIFYLPKTTLDFGKKNNVPGQHAASMFIGFGAGLRF